MLRIKLVYVITNELKKSFQSGTRIALNWKLSNRQLDEVDYLLLIFIYCRSGERNV